MIVSLVVAMDRDGVIGRAGRLPWHLSDDLRRFKAITMGKPLVMGRRTHESIGRVLPGRENIVVTRNPAYGAPGCTVLHSLEEVFAHCAGVQEIMIVGGAELYRDALPRADRIYLTEVQASVPGDTYFPPFDRSAYQIIEREDRAADARNEYPFSFLVLERR